MCGVHSTGKYMITKSIERHGANATGYGNRTWAQKSASDPSSRVRRIKLKCRAYRYRLKRVRGDGGCGRWKKKDEHKLKLNKQKHWLNTQYTVRSKMGVAAASSGDWGEVKWTNQWQLKHLFIMRFKRSDKMLSIFRHRLNALEPLSSTLLFQ